MKTPSRIILALSLGGLLAAGAGSAYAFGGGCDGPGARAGSMTAAYRVDDLSADQRKQLDTLRNQMRDQMRKQQDQARDDRDALRNAMERGADATTIRPLAEKQGQHMADMIVQQAEARAAVNKILTEAQRKQLEDARDDFGPRGHGRGQGMGW